MPDNQVFPTGSAFTHLAYSATIKLFGVDDEALPSRPGWVLLGELVGEAVAASTGAATLEQRGTVRPDGTTIGITDGVISVIGAAQGLPGEPGAPGEPGEPGTPGEPGAPGASAALSAIVFIPGKPVADALLLFLVVNQACTLPAAFAGTQLDALAAATADASFRVDVRQNGAWTVVGSITIQPSGTVLRPASVAKPLAVGDALRVTAASSEDATLADVNINVLLVRP